MSVRLSFVHVAVTLFTARIQCVSPHTVTQFCIFADNNPGWEILHFYCFVGMYSAATPIAPGSQSMTIATAGGPKSRGIYLFLD